MIGGALYGALAEPVVYDIATPEGVVQSYLQAILDDDEFVSRSYMVEELADRCTDAGFARTDGVRVFLDDVTLDGDVARVSLDIRHSSGGVDEYTESETLVLMNKPEGWRISEAPWPYWNCEGGF